jgi:hypothetical protein
MIRRNFGFTGLLILVLALALAMASCAKSSSSSSSKAAADDDATPVDDDDDATPADDDASPADDDNAGWPNLSDQLGTGEVRAGEIKAADELISGIRSAGQLGDYKIYNSRVRFVIRAPQHNAVGWIPYSGNLIDADRCRPAGTPGMDGLWASEQLFGLLRGYLVKSIQVISDGHNAPAVIRVVGKDAGIDIIDHLLPTWDYGLTVTTDYVLYPDKDYLVVKTTLKNNWPTDRHMLVADAPLWGDEMSIFSPRLGYGLEQLDLMADLRWIAGVSRRRQPVSYAIATINPDRKLWSPYVPSGSDEPTTGEILAVVENELALPAYGEATYARLFFIGTGDTASIQAMINAYDNNTNYGTIRGTVQLATGDDPSTIDVVVNDFVRPTGENYVGMARLDSGGHFTMQLPTGGYGLVASGAGRANSAQVVANVNAGEQTEVTLTIGQPGYVTYNATDSTGKPIPAKFSFQSGKNAAWDAPVVYRAWIGPTGQGTDSVLPGDYTITISRGYEYELATQNVTVTAGQTTPISGVLEHVVNTNGWMSGDFHIHTEFSVDSQSIAETRILELLAEDIEMPVFTDHDTVSDFSSYVEAINAQALIKPVRGMEISPTWGHFNSWPLTPPANAPDFFGIRLADIDENGDFVSFRTFPEMWAIARGAYGGKVIQVNHPRSNSMGWLTSIGYDRTLGVKSANQHQWSDKFDALEVWNSGFDDPGTLADWFSFLDQGLNYTMTGNSDSHTPSAMLGSPRDMFAMPSADPATADPLDMVDSILHQRNEVCNGPFITFTINGQGMGSFVTGVGDTVNLDVVVQAPSWVNIDHVQVYSNHGEVVATIPVDPTSTSVVRYTGSIPMTSTVDAYFVIETGSSTKDLGPMDSGQPPFAITNPIYVDFDGNGQWNPPGLPPTK